MYAYVYTANIDNLSPKAVKVEVAGYNGLPGIKITGLPDAVVRESFYRITTAFRACKIEVPLKRFVINFIPADIPKKGAGFDLPIAAALLKAIGVIPLDSLDKHLLYGELSLTGELRFVTGVLPILNFAQNDFARVVIPYMNSNEAYFFKDKALPVKNIMDLIKLANGEELSEYLGESGDWKMAGVDNDGAQTEHGHVDGKDFSDVIGQPVALRAAEIAAAGRHHLLLIGSPGCGKTMIGERVPGIMPPMNNDDKLEVNSIYSIAGLLGEKSSILHDRPCRAPHHTASDTALIGGSKVGEITLAHKGVLFLDELSEFKHNVLNALREPLEKGRIDISRANFSHSMPADFLLVAASNPCDCGNLLKRDGSCKCSNANLQRFQRRLNGPLMDRFDLKVVMTAPKVTAREMLERGGATEHDNTGINTSEKMRERVIDSIAFKNDLKSKNIRQKISEEAKNVLDRHIHSSAVSIRIIKKIINVSKTIAALENQVDVKEENILEAINYTRL
ncbi:MAG: YifB family Mg chelatase-like AAA ATPase [Pseudomonadota bacterium]